MTKITVTMNQYGTECSVSQEFEDGVTWPEILAWFSHSALNGLGYIVDLDMVQDIQL